MTGARDQGPGARKPKYPPKIKAAKDYAQKFNKNLVIILGIKGDQLEYASYGVNKGLCVEAQRLAECAFKALMKKGWCP